MRFMMLMYPGITADEWVPDPEQMLAMGKYNDELSKAGVLLALDGLHPADGAVHVTWSGGKPTVVDGPFAEAKEVVGGYWVIQVRTRDEAIEWLKRIPPVDERQTVELRQIQEMEDFSPELREALSQGA